MLFSIIRDKNTGQAEFVRAADRLMAILAEEGLARLPSVTPRKIATACGVYDGVSPPDCSNVCAVDIIRSGAILAEAVRRTCPEVKTGKILIQRNEETAEPELFYHKFPPELAQLQVLLCDPMLATGGSAIMAIEEMKKLGVKEENILFINLACAPEGLQALRVRTPKVRIVCLGMDSHLNAQKYIVPGIGDMGDRYYGS
jgi:uracil phosphoribosyltransferase